MREPVTDAVLRDPMLDAVGRLRAEGATYADLIACRGGNRNIVSSFRLYYSAYRAKDGGVVLGALTKANRDAMRSVLGIAGENSDDDGYNALDPVNAARIAEWREEIQRILLTRTAAEWVAAFQAAGAPVSVVNLPEEMSDDEQVEALGLMVPLEHDITGPQRLVGPVAEMSRTPPRVQRPSPPLGRHTDEILAEAGLSPAEISDLHTAGVLV
jgi:crotonobetainyl-CoA:carnitine CoA-transferase CaiB-like acyl-CoA transferase